MVRHDQLKVGEKGCSGVVVVLVEKQQVVSWMPYFPCYCFLMVDIAMLAQQMHARKENRVFAV